MLSNTAPAPAPAKTKDSDAKPVAEKDTPAQQSATAPSAKPAPTSENSKKALGKAAAKTDAANDNSGAPPEQAAAAVQAQSPAPSPDAAAELQLAGLLMPTPPPETATAGDDGDGDAPQVTGGANALAAVPGPSIPSRPSDQAENAPGPTGPVLPADAVVPSPPGTNVRNDSAGPARGKPAAQNIKTADAGKMAVAADPAQAAGRPAPAPTATPVPGGKNPAAGTEAALKSTGDEGKPAGDASKPQMQTADAAAQPPPSQAQPQPEPAPATAPMANTAAPAMVAAAPAPQQPGGNNSANLTASIHVTPHSATPDVNVLAVAIAARSQSGTKQFDIRLDPPELGHVEVRLSIDAAGKAQAHMSVDQPETLNLLQKDSSSLTQALRDAGLDVSHDGLNFSLRGQGGQDQRNQQGQNSGEGRRTSLAAARVIDAIQAPAALSLSGAAGESRLDIHV